MAAKTTPEEVEKRLADPHLRDVFYEKLMGRVLLTILPFAQKRTPVRTGTLRRSETTRVEKGTLRGYLGTNVNYAPFVHARVPFFQQAVTDSRAAVANVLEQEGDGYFQQVIA